MFSQQRSRLCAIAMLLLVAVLYCSKTTVDCAPTSSSNSNNRLLGAGLLSNLFRRQTGSSGSESSSTSTTESSTESTTESDTEDPQTQTELDAQKFMDSLPNPGANESGPTTFRERVSESFGLLRDGVSNQFRSLRENFSDTVEDLRDTWTNAE